MRVSARRRMRPEVETQLSLGIDLPGSLVTSVVGRTWKPSGRSGGQHQLREPELILLMKDVVRITGRHRATIHRWISEGEFPAKTVPCHRPIGWRASDIENWKRGSIASAER